MRIGKKTSPLRHTTGGIDPAHDVAFASNPEGEEHKKLHKLQATVDGDPTTTLSGDKRMTTKELEVYSGITKEQTFKLEGTETGVTGTTQTSHTSVINIEDPVIDKQISTQDLQLMNIEGSSLDFPLTPPPPSHPYTVVNVEPKVGDILHIGATSPFTFGSAKYQVPRSERIKAENLFKDFLISNTNANYSFSDIWDDNVDRFWQVYKDDFMKSTQWQDINPDLKKAFTKQKDENTDYSQSSDSPYLPQEFDYTNNLTRSDLFFYADRSQVFENNDIRTKEDGKEHKAVLHAGQVSPYVLSETYNIPVQEILDGEWEFVFYKDDQLKLGSHEENVTHNERVKTRLREIYPNFDEALIKYGSGTERGGYIAINKKVYDIEVSTQYLSKHEKKLKGNKYNIVRETREIIEGVLPVDKNISIDDPTAIQNLEVTANTILYEIYGVKLDDIHDLSDEDRITVNTLNTNLAPSFQQTSKEKNNIQTEINYFLEDIFKNGITLTNAKTHGLGYYVGGNEVGSYPLLMDFTILKELEQSGEVSESLRQKLQKSIMGSSILELIDSGEIQDTENLYKELNSTLTFGDDPTFSKGAQSTEVLLEKAKDNPLVKSILNRTQDNAMFQWKMNELYQNATKYTDETIAKLDSEDAFIAWNIGRLQTITNDNFTKLKSKYGKEIVDQNKKIIIHQNRLKLAEKQIEVILKDASINNDRIKVITSKDFVPEGTTREELDKITNRLKEIQETVARINESDIIPREETGPLGGGLEIEYDRLKKEYGEIWSSTKEELKTLNKTNEAYRNSLGNIHQNAQTDIVGIEHAIKNQVELHRDLSEIDLIQSVLGKNYHTAPRLWSQIKGTGVGFLSGSAHFLHRWVQRPIWSAMDYVFDQDNFDNFSENQYTEFQTWAREYQEAETAKFGASMQFDEIESGGDMLEYFGDLVSKQFWNVASIIVFKRPIFTVGKVGSTLRVPFTSGLILNGMSESGNAGLELKYANQYLGGNFSETEIALKELQSFGTTILGEAYTQRLLTKGFKMSPKFKSKLKLDHRYYFNNKYLNNFTTFTKNSATNTLNFVGGSLGETATEFFQGFSDNAFDNLWLGKDVNIWTGLDRRGNKVGFDLRLGSNDFWDSTIMGGLFQTPGLFRQAIRPFKSTGLGYLQKDLTNESRILINKLHNPDLSPLLRQYYSQQFWESETKIHAIDVLNIEVVSQMNGSEINELLDIDQQKVELQAEIEDIEKDENISNAETNTVVNQIKNEIQDLQEKSDVIIETYSQNIDFENSIETIKELAKKKQEIDGKPINIHVFNKKQVKHFMQQQDPDIQEEFADYASQQFGFIIPNTDGSTTIIINKETGLGRGKTKEAFHEFLHEIVFATIRRNQFSQDAIGDALIELIATKDGYVSAEFIETLESYEGDPNFGEEVLMAISNAMITGDIVFDENVMDKAGDVFRRYFQGNGVLDIQWNNGQQVFNFIKDYNATITGKYKSAEKIVLKVGTEGVGGKLTAEGQQEIKDIKDEQQFSKNVDQETSAKPDLKTDFDNLVQSPDGVKKYETKESFQQSVDFFPAYDMIVNSPKLDGLVMANVGDVIQPTQMSEFVDKVKEKVGDRLMKNFDPGINESLFGWLTGKSGGRGESIIFRAKGDVMNEYKKEIQMASLDQDAQKMLQIEAKADASLEAFENQDLTKEKVKKVKGIKLSEKLGPVSQDINRSVKSKAVGMDVSNLNFKKLKDLTPESTQEMFGIVPKAGNLTKQDIKNAQMFINKNADVLKAMLPEGSTASGTSTGVQKVLLDNFYTKSDRVKTSKTGSKAGLAIQIKNQNIDTKQFLDVFGITERGKENTYKKDSNTSARIKALVDQTGRMMTNQAVREHLIERQESIQTIQKLSEGKADIMFSKDEKLKKDVTEVEKIIQGINVKYEFSDQEAKVVDEVLNKFELENSFDLKTEGGREAFIEAVKTQLFPLLPKEFFFTIDKDGNVTNDIFTYSNKNYGLSMNNVNEAKIYNKFRENVRALAADPDITFGAPIKGANWDLTKGYNTIFGNKDNYKEKLKDTEAIKEWNANIALIHKEMWSRFNNTISNNPMQAQVIASYLKLTANDKQSWHRLGAQYAGHSESLTEREDGKAANIEFEHAMPATAAYLYLLNSSLSGSNFNASYDLVIENYKLIVLDKAMDDKLRGARTESGYSLMKRMPDNWSVIENSWWERYFNDIVYQQGGGINPSSIIGLDGKTFAETFNINAKGKLNIIKTDIESKMYQSKAINNSRAINEDTASRGMSAWDFDDTLATTKSGVMATIPNLDGTPQPGRKVIFLAGGAGSGKGNVISKLGLQNQGFKVVNQDISLEWLKKNHGLPENMNDLTKEQRSTLGKLGHQARTIAKGKMMKYQGNAEGVVVDGTGGSINAMENLVNEFKDKGYDVSMLFVETSLETALERNKARKERSLLDKMVIKNHEAVQGNKDGFVDMFGDRFMEVETDNLTQKDAMPTDLVGKMNDFVSGYKKVRLDAEEFAAQGAEILEQGGEFDFSEFDVVTEGETGPMFKAAMDRAKKFGTKDTYILTARPPAAVKPIHEFLESQGLNIPIENITGLGNSTGEAKAEWMLEKFSEGYNNMFFADDAMQNVEAVKNVLDQLDIKSKVVQAKIQFSKSVQSTVDEILDGPELTKTKEEASINNVKNVDRLLEADVYSNIQFSKKHRGEYENTISKHRPDLVKEGKVSQTIDAMFVFVDNLNISNDKKRKYEKITTKWLATSNVKLIEDRYKITDAVNLAERYKLDLFSYNNPNEIIEAYAGKVKDKVLDPNEVVEFSPGTVLNKKHGLTIHEVENTKEGQQAVRNIIDSHWGENSNPWCLAQAREGKLTDDAWISWRGYEDGPKRIIFQDGKLLAFYANDMYWDRMDNDTDHVVVQIKEGRVTNKVELIPEAEFVMETRTVSEDKKTVTTEYFVETKEYNPGHKLIEDKVNGVTTKSTLIRSDGTIQTIKEFKNKSISTTYDYGRKGNLEGLNTKHGIQEQDVAFDKGDIISIEVIDENINITYIHGFVNLDAQKINRDRSTHPIAEIGFKTPVNYDLINLTQTIDGKQRIDLKKVLEIDPDVKGLPRRAAGPGIQFSKDADLNKILEETTGVQAKKRFSDAQAKLRGKGFKLRGLVPPSAQDFAGLLYNFIDKGKKGEQQFETLKKALIDPFARGVNELNTARQNSAEDYRNLLKEFPEVKKILNEKIGDTGFTVDQAVRVYLWNKSGFDVPGLSVRDLKTLNEFVETDGELQAFADGLGLVSKKTEGYSKPGEFWLTENIASDLMSDGAIGDARSEFLAEWQGNVDQIFSKENLNKIEVIYGYKFREALEDILYRMETGRNRQQGASRLMNTYMNWVNQSVGAIMFFNIRSAVLQTISATNYVNWSDNNPLRAATAFANQKQFWSDFVFIFNSDMLKQRRAGLKYNVNEAELAAAVANSDNKMKAALNWLLKKGFTPTQIADSAAISGGGATFYRNRIRSLVKKGIPRAKAEKQAWLDFQETTEVSQQSARPDLISQQQANPLGRLILAFQNTPMQYGRIMNKAFRDIANGRGDTKTHVSKIVYYGGIQAVIFTALQSAMFAVIGTDDDDEKEEMIDKKSERMVNSMIDSWLSVFGYGGKAVSTMKNTIMEYNKQRAKDLDEEFMTRSDHAYTLLQVLGFSPPIGSKLRKIYQSIQTEKFNRDLMKERGFTLDNPVWSMIGNVIEGVTNIPLGRLSNKMLNIDNAMDSSNEMWQRAAMLLGWNTWDLGIKDPDIVALGENIKERKKQEKKIETEKKKFEKKQDKLKEKYPDKTDEEIEVILKSKELMDLGKQQQIDLLKSLDVSDKDIKNLKKEKDRTDKIAELYKDNSKLIDNALETKTKPKIKTEKEKVVELSKELFDLSKQEQIDLLKSLDISDREIKNLKKEQNRTDKIAELYKDNSKLINDAIKTSKTTPKKERVKKEEVKLSKSEQHEKDLYKMKKKDQVNLLLEYGLSNRKIKTLKYEKDRVEMIIKLESKSK